MSLSLFAIANSFLLVMTCGVFSESVCNRQQFSVCDDMGGGGVSESVCSRQQFSTYDDLWCVFSVCMQ